MPSDVPVSLQTIYAELLDRAASADFTDAFREDGTFVAKDIRGRRYWYFQEPAEAGRRQRYVGPETPALLERIARHKSARANEQDRRVHVSMLVRSALLPRPPAEVGEIVAALAEAGVFRLRGVLVGTVAYQTYPAMLGERLPLALVQTGDVDIAQFTDVSVAIGDATPPLLDVLRRVDRSFRAVPHLHGASLVTAFKATRGPRVGFLTPNRGPDTDKPRRLPALGVHAQPLRFLDFLIRDPEPAVLLHGTGVFVQVPAPQRYALHKLIVARRSRVGAAKAEKDISQAASLLDVLVRKRPHELVAAWQEAWGRGATWRRLLGEGLALIHPGVRDRTLKVVGAPRSIVAGLDLAFEAPAAAYDSDRDVAVFFGKAAAESVRCEVSGEAFDDYVSAQSLDREARLRLFREHRLAFERLARAKYLTQPIEEPGRILIRTEDIDKLKRAARR